MDLDSLIIKGLDEGMTLRDGILAVKNIGFLNLDIEGNSKIVVDSHSRKIIIHVFIMLLMEDIWKLAQDLNIYICRHVYRKANGTTYCLAKKGIGILETSVWRSNFPKDLINASFEDYCGPFSNHVCKISIMKSSFIK